MLSVWWQLSQVNFQTLQMVVNQMQEASLPSLPPLWTGYICIGLRRMLFTGYLKQQLYLEKVKNMRIQCLVWLKLFERIFHKSNTSENTKQYNFGTDVKTHRGSSLCQTHSTWVIESFVSKCDPHTRGNWLVRNQTPWGQFVAKS